MSVTLPIEGITVKVITQSTWCNLIGYEGFTLGSTIRLKGHPLSVRPELLCHEFGHVLQFRERGIIKGGLQYLWDLARYGYNRGMPEEADAIKYQETQWSTGKSATWLGYVAKIQHLNNV